MPVLEADESSSRMAEVLKDSEFSDVLRATFCPPAQVQLCRAAQGLPAAVPCSPQPRDCREAPVGLIRQGTACCHLFSAAVPLPIFLSHPMALGEVTEMKNSSSPLLARQAFLEQKLLQGNALKRHGVFSSEPFFPPALLHHSLILILCHRKLQQVCAAHIN